MSFDHKKIDYARLNYAECFDRRLRRSQLSRSWALLSFGGAYQIFPIAYNYTHHLLKAHLSLHGIFATCVSYLQGICRTYPHGVDQHELPEGTRQEKDEGQKAYK